MQIPKEIEKCVVFVGYQTASGEYQAAGTAFYACRMIEGTDYFHTYLVTVKHNIDGVRRTGQDKVGIRVNHIDGRAMWLESDINRWVSHPNDSNIDLAVLSTQLSDELDHVVYPLTSIATDAVITENEIGVGDEVFLPGLFVNHYGTHSNIPIVRFGNIAAMPREKVKTEFGLFDAYLLEARSLGGFSGSPVFVNLGITRMMNGRIVHAQGQPIFKLLGLMHGHWNGVVPNDMKFLKNFLHMGISIVVPATKIFEVLEHPKIKQTDKKVADGVREKS